MSQTGNSADEPAQDAGEVVDDISAHMPVAREIDRAALVPGMYLAWCARLGLLDRAFSEHHAQHILRLHYNDGSCVEMLVAACGGTLRFEHLNPRGAEFTRRYYSGYLADWQRTFGDDVYGVEDSWENYHRIAAVLTPALLGSPDKQSAESGKPRGERWWQFWKK